MDVKYTKKNSAQDLADKLRLLPASKLSKASKASDVMEDFNKRYEELKKFYSNPKG